MECGLALQEAFAAMTPELWDLIPLALEPAPRTSCPGGAGAGAGEPAAGWPRAAPAASLCGAPPEPLGAPGPAPSSLLPPPGVAPASEPSPSASPAGPGRREGARALPRFPAAAAAPPGLPAAPSEGPAQGPGRKKRKRNLYSREQLHLLESFFHRKQYPSLPEAEMLAGVTGLTYQQIRVWFQNRRGKHRRLYAGDGTPGSSLCTPQTQFLADPRHDPFSQFNWPTNSACSGPTPGMQWALWGPAHSAFHSRIDLPPHQPLPTVTDFQAYSTWAPQSSTGTSPPAGQPVTVNSSFLHIPQIQSAVDQCR